MIKMLYALIAIASMFLANFTITYARTLKKGGWRILLTTVAFLLWIPIVLFVIAALF